MKAAAMRRPRGVTLVELMVAIAIGLFLVAVMGAIYLGSKGTFAAQSGLARLQENGRFAIDAIAGDLRMAGFRGCMGNPAKAVNNTLNKATEQLFALDQGLWASRHGGAAWAPALDAGLAAALVPAPSTDSDVLVVRRPLGNGWALTQQMAADTAALNVSATPTLRQGDLLMVSDCNAAAVFQATNPNPGAGVILHVPAAAGAAPGVATAALGKPYLQDALVYRMATIVYYVAPSVRRPGVGALWQLTQDNNEGASAPVELVTGVQAMRVRVGLDTVVDATPSADRYLPPQSVVDWRQAVSARIELLLVSGDDQLATAPQPYTFDGVATTPVDRRLRAVMSTTASLRNSLP